MNGVPEGVSTVKIVHKLSKKLEVDMPITNMIYQVIYNKYPLQKAVKGLMGRSLKAEY
jgi:glycerol-3-phosphate dehydrogenase (NAD(P)+)